MEETTVTTSSPMPNCHSGGADATVVVRPEAFGAAWGVIAPDARQSREFRTVVRAREYAASIAAAAGWTVRDDTVA